MNTSTLNILPSRSTRSGARYRALAIAICGVVGTSSVAAMPLERFETPLRITCEEGQRFCSSVVRVPDALGRHTGIAITKSSMGEVSVEVSRSTKGRLAVAAEGVLDLTLTLSWDGDSNPEQLSGAGLNCFDLTQQGASALIVSGAEMRSECGEVVTTAECPSLSAEARVYNPADPTGQKFLVSLGRRNISEQADIIIPFSNFVGQGPRGKASFGCVGAVTIAFTFRGFKELDFSVGPVYSNGLEGLTPLPTPTQIPTETPTTTPTVTPTDTATATRTATPSPTVTRTPTITNAPAGTLTAEDLPVGTVSAVPTAEPPESLTVVTPIESVEASTQSAPVATPDATRLAPPAEDEFGGEAVYGELVSG